jgi:murein DD-endopeptidase MepM/ murein hydrolase activator NlpD
MRSRIPFLGISFTAIVFALLIFWANPSLSPAKAQGENDDAQNQLDQINENRAVLQQRIDQLEGAQNLAHDELEDVDRDLSLLESRREQTTSQLDRKRAQVDALNRSHAQAMADLEASQSQFELRLIEWYKAGPGSMLGSLITHGNLSDFLFAISYTEKIIQNDKDTISFIKDQQSRIFEQKAQLDSEIAECERLITDMRSQETQYADLHQRRTARLNEIAGSVEEAENALRELEASSYEIGMLLRSSSYAGGSAGTAFIRPIDAAIGSGFGMRMHPILHRTRMHTGVDMSAPGGTPIHAAGSGLVVYSGWKRGYGNCITIDHGNGLATLYAHCSQLLVSVGETVSRGQVIAKVGTTGLSTGNHLHFEVRINGEPVDPTPYI